MAKIGVHYGSYLKIKTVVSLFGLLCSPTCAFCD